MEKVNLSNIVNGSNVTINTTTTFRTAPDGKIQADTTVRKTTSGLAGDLKSEEKTENFTYLGTPDGVKSQIDEAGHTGDLLTTNTQGV